MVTFEGVKMGGDGLVSGAHNLRSTNYGSIDHNKYDVVHVKGLAKSGGGYVTVPKGLSAGEQADYIQKTYSPVMKPEQKVKKEDVERTWSELGKDSSFAVSSGSAATVKDSLTVADMVTPEAGKNRETIDNGFRALDEFSEAMEDGKSEHLKIKKYNRDLLAEQRAGEDGLLWDLTKFYIQNPSLIMDEALQSAPSFVPSALAGRAVGGLSMLARSGAVAQRSAAALAAGKSPEVVARAMAAAQRGVQKTAEKTALRTSVATGAAQEGASYATQVRDEMSKIPDADWDQSPVFLGYLAKNGGNREAAKQDLIKSVQWQTFIPAALTVKLGSYVPGAKDVRKWLLGQRSSPSSFLGKGANAVGAAVAGALDNAQQEGVSTLAKQKMLDNAGVGHLVESADPSIAAVSGLAGGFGISAVGGTMHHLHSAKTPAQVIADRKDAVKNYAARQRFEAAFKLHNESRVAMGLPPVTREEAIRQKEEEALQKKAAEGAVQLAADMQEAQGGVEGVEGVEGSVEGGNGTPFDGSPHAQTAKDAIELDRRLSELERAQGLAQGETPVKDDAPPLTKGEVKARGENPATQEARQPPQQDSPPPPQEDAPQQAAPPASAYPALSGLTATPMADGTLKVTGENAADAIKSAFPNSRYAVANNNTVRVGTSSAQSVANGIFEAQKEAKNAPIPHPPNAAPALPPSESAMARNGQAGEALQKTGDTQHFVGASKPFSAYLDEAGGSHFKAAKSFFKNELQRRFVKTAIGKVHMLGMSWQEMRRDTRRDPQKAEAMQHIPDILKTGEYGGREKLTKERKDGFIAFHSFSKAVTLHDGKTVQAAVKVGERADGNYQYIAYSIGKQQIGKSPLDLHRENLDKTSGDLSEKGDKTPSDLKSIAHSGTDAKQPKTAPVLQNRNRATPASIAQMQSIASQPDFGRLGYSRDFANGAPVIVGNAPGAVLGKTDYAVASDGRRIPVQYAVVPAGSVAVSNEVSGAPNPGYEAAPVKAVAGNGRMAGLAEAHRQGKAQDYVKELSGELASLGIDPALAAKVKNPALVRVMPESRVTQNIGDLSNTSGNLSLSATEQAANDARRLDVSGLSFGEDGRISAQSVRQFVAAMPQTEQGSLMDSNGQPTRQAYDRLEAALFANAYGDAELTRLASQATDSEARNVVTALSKAAAKMQRLIGTGVFDIRQVVADAAKIAINAKRNNRPLSEVAAQSDLEAAPGAEIVLSMMAKDQRSATRMAEKLERLADLAYREATRPDTDMLGETPAKMTRREILETLNDGEENHDAGSKRLEHEKGRVAPTEHPGRGRTDGEGSGNALADAPAEQAGETRRDKKGGHAEEESVKPGFALYGQTDGEAAADHAAKQKQEADKAKADQDAEAKARAEREHREIRDRSAAASETFELGGNAEDNLSGQGGLFDERPQVKENAVPLTKEESKLKETPESKSAEPYPEKEKNRLVGIRDKLLSIFRKDYAKPVTVEALNGDRIIVSYQGLEHALHGVPSEYQSLVATRVQDVIRQSSITGVETDKKGRQDPKTVSRYAAQVRIDGQLYDVTLVVRNHSDGNRYYDHAVMEKARQGNSESSREGPPTQPFSGLSLSLGEVEEKINSDKAFQEKPQKGNAPKAAEVRDSLIKRFGKKVVAALEKSGFLKIHETGKDAAKAMAGKAGLFSQAQNTLRKAFNEVKADKTNNKNYPLFPVSPVAVEEAKAHNLDIEGFTHTVDGSAIRHTIKNHGDEAREKARGNIAVTEADFASIPEILDSPDKVIYGLKNGIGRDMIGYLKQMPDGSTLYLEEVRTGRKTLGLQSMRRYPRTTSADFIVKSLRPTSETLPGNAFSIVDHPAGRNGALFQSAFHGSPYSFEKFMLAHIGTGEGAQAYGWGLYFAGEREVAEEYRKKLSSMKENDPTLSLLGESGDYDISRIKNDEVRDAVQNYLDYAHEIEEGSEEVDFGDLKKKTENDLEDAETEQDREKYQGILDEIDALSGELYVYPGINEGQLYEVEIPENDVLLDWDKPLSEQPENVKQGLRAAYIARGMPLDGDGNPAFFGRNPDGQSLYASISGIEGAQYGSELLNKHGIQGIRYLDGNSRKEGEGSHNYVVFDENAIGMLNTFYQMRAEESSPGSRLLNAQGFFDPETGTIHLVAENLGNGEAPATLLHEAFHKALSGMLGTKRYDYLMRRLSFIERNLSKSSAWFKQAAERIPEADRKNRSRYLNELAAYAITEYESAPRSLPESVAKWVQDFIAGIRAFLMEKFGLEPGTLSAADLSAIARRHLESAAQETGAKTSGRFEPLGGKEAQGKGDAQSPTNQTGEFFHSEKGRAQPLSAKVLTPGGYRRMGELQAGDAVTAFNGETTKVTGVFPQGRQAIYRLTLSDGSAARSTLDHLWSVREDGKADFQALPLSRIRARMGAGKRYEIHPLGRAFSMKGDEYV